MRIMGNKRTLTQIDKLIWHTEQRTINNLIPYPENPRQMTEKQKNDLEQSLLRFNLMSIPVINTDNMIISGHQRMKILQLLGRGEEKIDVRVPNRGLTEEEYREANLRENKNLGEWDFDMLANFNEEILMDVGFEREELDNIFGLEIDEDYDVDKELNKILKNGKRRVGDGDIWQLGEHRLIIGDCVKQGNWEKLLGKERFDFMFTDPPYKLAYTKKRFKGWVKTKKGFGYRGQRHYKGIEERGGVPEYDEWLSIANDFQNPKGTNVMVFENWRNTIEIWQAIAKYWKIKNMIIWWLPNRCQGFSRPGYFFNKYDIAPLAGEGVRNEGYEEEFEKYLQDKGQKLLDTYEVIIYGQKGKGYWDRRKGTLWAKVADHITHAAETGKSGGQNIIFGTKPIQILVPYIKILSPRDGIVAEPFCGSGSTIIACDIMHRKCRAIEIEPIYGEVTLARWEKFTNKKAVKINEQ